MSLWPGATGEVSRDRSAVGSQDLIACVAVIAAGVSIAAFTLGLVPAIDPNRAATAAAQVAEDNAAVCGRLHFDTGTPGYAACLTELDKLREHDRQLREEPLF